MLPKMVYGSLAVLVLLCTPAGVCEGRMPDKDGVKMNEIVASKTMSKAAKIKELRKYLKKRPDWFEGVLWRIAQVDKTVARKIALERFRRKGISRKRKLTLGSEILQNYSTPEFIDEYGKFLLNAVLKGGKKRFCRKREVGELSAVGEYAFIAGDVAAHSPKKLAKIKDARVIRILISCLKAPDNIYGSFEHQGDNIRGKPGELTGRNLERQQIPIALAKLGATQAIAPLKKTLMTHHDRYLRNDSAYALALLMKKKDCREFAQVLKRNKDYRQSLFSFGRGLIEKGDDDGVEYMAFEYAIEFTYEAIGTVLFMVIQRLDIVRDFKSRKLAAFYQQALAYEPFYNILLFDDTKVNVEWELKQGKIYSTKTKQRETVTNAKEVLHHLERRITPVYKDLLNGIKANELEGFAEIIDRIGRRTESAAIWKLSEAYLKETGQQGNR